MYICVCVYMYIYVYTCMCIYTYNTYIDIYICIYTRLISEPPPPRGLRAAPFSCLHCPFLVLFVFCLSYFLSFISLIFYFSYLFVFFVSSLPLSRTEKGVLHTNTIKYIYNYYI